MKIFFLYNVIQTKILKETYHQKTGFQVNEQQV